MSHSVYNCTILGEWYNNVLRDICNILIENYKIKIYKLCILKYFFFFF